MARKKKPVSVDTKAGSLAYNRLDMQASQALHMAIEFFPDLNYLLVLDHYDDITVFDDDISPETVSYYQVKTNEESISIHTAISESWLAKLHKQLDRPEWIVNELGLITNCPLTVTVSFKDRDGKTQTEEKNYTSEKTAFSTFNPLIIKKIKEDISKREGIALADVDLSKFVHMRTTLSIPKHREIVEQEMGDFLYHQHPRITLDSVKTIFASMMNLITKRQEYELLSPDAPFTEVRKHKGVSRSELSRIISDSMALSIPPFEEIDRLMCYPNDDEKCRASYQYTLICADIQKKSESFNAQFRKILETCSSNPKTDEESAREYSERIYALLPYKNPLYNKAYILVLIAGVLINEGRRQR